MTDSDFTPPYFRDEYALILNVGGKYHVVILGVTQGERKTNMDTCLRRTYHVIHSTDPTEDLKIAHTRLVEFAELHGFSLPMVDHEPKIVDGTRGPWYFARTEHGGTRILEEVDRSHLARRPNASVKGDA